MSLRTSRKRFRPTMDRCESRDLPSAGLVALTAHANRHLVPHAPSQVAQVVQSEALVELHNDTKRAIRYEIVVKNTATGATLGTDGKTLDPKKLYFYWAPSKDSPGFSVTYDSFKGQKSTVTLIPKYADLDPDKLARNQYATRYLEERAAKYTFREKETGQGTFVELVA